MGSCGREKKKPEWRNGKLIRSVADTEEGGDLRWSVARQGYGVAWLLQRLAISVMDKILTGSVDSGCGWNVMQGRGLMASAERPGFRRWRLASVIGGDVTETGL
ncbi:sel1 repeat family protein [Sesbania bispinosa]|nr:sel1 repeat family protein [Sesbania bispinosa]